MPSTSSAGSCVHGALPATPPRRRGEDSGGDGRGVGWGGRDRTYECRNQNPVPYHLATPQNSSHPPTAKDAAPSPAPQSPACLPATVPAPVGPELHHQTRRRHMPRIRSCAHRHIAATTQDDEP